MNKKYDFKYVSVGESLSGESFISQTEQAFNEVGELADEAKETAENAKKESLDIANGALKKSEEAVSTANKAETLANEALVLSEDAKKNASEAKNEADDATKKANDAYDRAVSADTKSDLSIKDSKEALEISNNALTNSESAISTSTDAKGVAESALEISLASRGRYVPKNLGIDLNDLFDEPVKYLLLGEDNTGGPNGIDLYGSFFDTSTSIDFSRALQELKTAQNGFYFRYGIIKSPDTDEEAVEWQDWTASNPTATPIGFEALWPATTAPEGWLDESLNHGLLDRKTYEELSKFALESGNILPEDEWLAQVAKHGFCGSFSSGDGETTFRIPLRKSEFVRSAGEGLELGQNGIDQMRPIFGKIGNGSRAPADGAGSALYATGVNTSDRGTGTHSWSDLYIDSSRQGDHYDGKETTPKYTVRLPIIKAFRSIVNTQDVELIDFKNQLDKTTGLANDLNDNKSEMVIVYPNGTEKNPYTIGLTEIVDSENPFASENILLVTQILWRSKWVTAGHYTHYIETTGKHSSRFCESILMDKDIIRTVTGLGGLTSAPSAMGGGAYGGESENVTKAPFRIKVFKIGKSNE